jgi:hypothetical protein
VLVAAAVVSTPPLLVPEVAAGSAERDADLRATAVAAVGRLLATGPDRLVVVGEAATTGPLSGEPTGTGSASGWRRRHVRCPCRMG